LITCQFKRNVFNLIVVICFLCCAGCAGDSAIKKDRALAMQNLGVSLASQGNLRGGLEQLLKAVELDPERADLHHDLALVYKGLYEYKLSLEHFNKALILKRDFPEAQNNFGTLYVVLQEWDLAIACFQNAANDLLYKTPHFAYHNIGSVYYKQGKYEKAVENYLQAIKYSASYVEAWFDLGCTYEILNKNGDAINAYNTAILHNPDHPAPHFNLGKLYLKLNRIDDGAKELNLAIKADPDGAFATESAKLLANMGQN